MRSLSRMWLAPVLLVGGIFYFGACEESPAIAIDLEMSAPQGVLDEASSVKLSVFPASGHKCGADGGVGTIPEDAKQFDLKKSGCDQGAKWCGDVTLDQDGSKQMFFVEAKSGKNVLGQGCAAATIDQDPINVSIKIVRFVAPSCCGDGTLQAGELCDTGGNTECGGTTGDAVCATDCSTKKLPVSWVEGTAPLAAGESSSSITFAAGTGELAGGLRAAYQTDPLGNSDIGVRYFRSDLSQVTTPLSLGKPHKLMIKCSGTDSPIQRSQKTPKIASFGADSAIVAFRSNFSTPLRDDVYVAVLNDSGCSTDTAPALVSDGIETVDAVDIARGPGGNALVVWQESGSIRAAGVSPTGGVMTEMTIDAQGSSPRVSGGNQGWVIAYRGSGTDDDDGILARRVTMAFDVSNAIPVNTETAGVQDQPDVAMLNDGRYAVTWRNGAEVLAQRFSADDTPSGGDQETALQTGAAPSAPAIEADSTLTYYVVAWTTGTEIRARYLGGSTGFLANPISGQNDDFVVIGGLSAASDPSIALGASVVVSWTEASGGEPGIFIRRLPVPTL